MIKAKGFTLIELLVVIAIIALLLSIVMPSLARVKGKARSLVCKANLKQWGLIVTLYSEANDGRMQDNGDGMPSGQVWYRFFEPYYQEPDLMLCPSAKVRSADTTLFDATCYRGYSNKAYATVYTDRPDDMGSYAMNAWIQNPTQQGDRWWDTNYGDYYWRTPSVTGAASIPAFLDGAYRSLNPIESDGNQAPSQPEDMNVGWSNSMKRVCIDRHSGAVNVVFLDGHSDEVGLKALWSLKWSRQWQRGRGPSNAWPEWMRQFKDYNYND